MPLVAFTWILFAGLAINNENAPERVQTLDDVKVAIEKTVDEVKARDEFVSFKLND